MQVIISKGEMWDLLGDKALPFASFLETSQGAPIKTILMTAEIAGQISGSIDLNSKIVQTQLLPMLLAGGIIDQPVMDRVNARISLGGNSTPVSVPAMRRFIITSTEMLSEEAVRAWVLPYCSVPDPYISYNHEGNIVVELSGVCTAPGAQEVTNG